MFGNANIVFINPARRDEFKRVFEGCISLSEKLSVPEPYYFESAMINDRLELSIGIDFDLSFDGLVADSLKTTSKGRIVHSDNLRIGGGRNIDYMTSTNCESCDQKSGRHFLCFVEKSSIASNTSTTKNTTRLCMKCAATSCKLSTYDLEARISAMIFVVGLIDSFIGYNYNRNSTAYRIVEDIDVVLKNALVSYLNLKSTSPYEFLNPLHSYDNTSAAAIKADKIISFLHEDIDSWKNDDFLKFYHHAYLSNPFVATWNISLFNSLIPILVNRYENIEMKKNTGYHDLIGTTIEVDVTVRNIRKFGNKHYAMSITDDLKVAYAIDYSSGMFFANRNSRYHVVLRISEYRLIDGVKYTVAKAISSRRSDDGF